MDDSWHLTRMTKVEVVIGGDDVSAITDMFSQVGATGFTAVSGVSGLGHSGYHQGRLLFNDRSTLTMLTVVVPNELAGMLLKELRPLLERRSGVMFVSDTWVSRPEYFQ
ncbi:MAG: transcriptional regulator [Actinomycetota bacterium]|nr:transcriptional regulator [Actinomycetota bacterium]